MMHRALTALLLILLVTPLPALCQACVSGTCLDQVTAVEEHDHADMGHADMGHADMGHADMRHEDMGHATEDRVSEAPSCHQATAVPNTEAVPSTEQAHADETLSVQTSDPSCCSMVDAPAPIPAALAHGFNVSLALATIELAETVSSGLVVSTSETTPQAPPPLEPTPLYTLLHSLLI